MRAGQSIFRGWLANWDADLPPDDWRLVDAPECASLRQLYNALLQMRRLTVGGVAYGGVVILKSRASLHVYAGGGCVHIPCKDYGAAIARVFALISEQ